MANTYIQIGSTVTVGAGGAANIEFTSIPSTYTDLQLVLSTRLTDSRVSLLVKVNGSSSGYSYRSIWGYVAGVSSFSGSSGTSWQIQYPNGSADTSSTFNSSQLYIPNYAGSTAKSASSDTVRENNASGSESAHEVLMAHLWSGTAAISSIAITVDSAANIAQYSTASLYGISKS
jgi:hypothetical protein